MDRSLLFGSISLQIQFGGFKCPFVFLEQQTMDSGTQIILGAAVGEAVLGKKMGNKAMLWGAIAGTIPDLDVLLRYVVDDITATEMHRGFSHSFVFAVVIAPILGWIAWKVHRKREDVSLKNWSWLFFWATVTHPLLDAHTTWGTQFLWPFEYRLAYQNIFVVDPFYTVPFLIFLLLALFHRRGSVKRRRFNNLGLIVSSAYMALTFVFKGVAHQEFAQGLAENKIEYRELDTKPTPMNTILWMAQVETEDDYRIAYYSLFDREGVEFSRGIPKNHHLLEPYKDQKVAQQLVKVSAGWYFIEEKEDKMIFWDLRFGQAGIDPNASPFLWSYDLKVDELGQLSAVRNDPNLENMGQAFSELLTRMGGN